MNINIIIIVINYTNININKIVINIIAIREVILVDAVAVVVLEFVVLMLGHILDYQFSVFSLLFFCL